MEDTLYTHAHIKEVTSQAFGRMCTPVDTYIVCTVLCVCHMTPGTPGHGTAES